MDASNIIRNRFVKIVNKVSMEITVTKCVESVEMEQFATVLMACVQMDVKIIGYYLIALYVNHIDMVQTVP